MNFIDKMVERFMKLNRRMKRWKRAVSVMAAIVVFVTTYMMILPAITLDVEAASTQAGMESVETAPASTQAGMESVETAPEQEENKESFGAEQEEDSGSDSGSREAEEEQDDADHSDAAGEDTDSESDEGGEENVLTDQDTDTVGDDETNGGDAEANADDETEMLSEEADTASTEMAAPEIELITEETQLTFETDDYIVYADFGENARLPVGVELRVREITKESDPEAYQAYYELALSQMQDKYDEYSTLSFARFYDVTFVYEEAEIEPSGDVKVRIEYKNVINVASDTTVDAIHFDKEDEGNAEVIDSEVETESVEQKRSKKASEGKTEPETVVKAVEFESDRFSVYGIVGTQTITAEYLTADGNTYEVTVTCDAEAAIPKDAWLKVEEVTSADYSYDDYIEKAAGAIDSSVDELNYIKLLNISIVDGNGEKITPEAPVDVQIRLLDQERVDETTQIIHFAGEAETPEVIIPSVGEDEVSFATDGFSIYAIASVPRLTIKFYANSSATTPFDQQIIRNGGTIKYPDMSSISTRFKGFYNRSGGAKYTNFNTPVQVTSSSTLNLEARFGNYKIVYYDGTGSNKVITTDEWSSGYKIRNWDISIPIDAKYSFSGWKVRGGSTTYSVGQTLSSLSSDLLLEPVLVEGRYVHFDSQGGTAIQSQFVHIGNKATRPTDPERSGYTFNGWLYNGSTYNFNTTINTSMPANGITLTANWTPASAEYKVYIWLETSMHAGGSSPFNAANYELGAVITKTGITGQNPSYIDSVDGQLASVKEVTYTHTHDPYPIYFIDHADVSGAGAIQGDGSTVLNVYYNAFEWIVKVIRYPSGGSPQTGTVYYQFPARMYETTVHAAQRAGLNLESDSLFDVRHRIGVLNNGTTKFRGNHGGTGLYDDMDRPFQITNPEDWTNYWSNREGYPSYVETIPNGSTLYYALSENANGPFIYLRQAWGESIASARNRIGNGEQYKTLTIGSGGVYDTLTDLSEVKTLHYLDFGFDAVEGYDFYALRQDKTNLTFNWHTGGGTYDKYTTDRIPWKDPQYEGSPEFGEGDGYSVGLHPEVYYGMENVPRNRWPNEGTEYTVPTNVQVVRIFILRKTYTLSFETNGGPYVAPIEKVPYEDHLAATGDTYYTSRFTYNEKGTQKLYTVDVTEWTDSEGKTWVFKGWYEDSTFLTPLSSNTVMPSSAKQLYAKWVEKPIQLDYNPNGGSLSPDPSGSISFGTIPSKPADPTPPTGKTFVCWTLNGDYYNFTTPLYEDTTLVAVYRDTSSYTITYQKGAGSGTAPTDTNGYLPNATAVILDKGSSLTPPSGKYFTGWTDGTNFYLPGATVTMTKNLTLTAVYEGSKTAIYYNANGGSGTLTDLNGTVTDVLDSPIYGTNQITNIEPNAKVTLSSGSGFTRPGYQLIGWNNNKANANNGIVQYAFGAVCGVDEYTAASQNTLYAVWDRLIDITITKAWSDSSNAYGLRPSDLTLTLLQNGTPMTGAPTPTVTKSGDSWTYKWSGVPEKNINGTGAAYTYTVAENSVPSGYSVSGSPASNGGTITNTLSIGSLTVTKTIVDQSADSTAGLNTKFTFTVTPPNGITLSNDQITFQLGHGESKQLNVPYGTYTVAETAVSGWTTTVNVGSSNIVTGTSTAVTVSGSNVTAAFTNTRKSLDINVLKVDKVTNIALTGAQFKLTQVDANGHVVANGIQKPSTAVGADGKVTFTGLTIGRYQLEETLSPNGYIKTTESPIFEIVEINGELAVNFTNTQMVTYTANTKTFTVKNTPGAELPETGGPGTLPYTLSGLALILASALMYGFRMRRRERRLY